MKEKTIRQLLTELHDQVQENKETLHDIHGLLQERKDILDRTLKE
jgi:hypothetical protein